MSRSHVIRGSLGLPLYITAVFSSFTTCKYYIDTRQSLELDFDPNCQLKWPSIFEERLNSLRSTSESGAPLKTQGRTRPKEPTDANLQFIGTGTDLEDDFHAIGWLNPLPDQCGIPGWQRITFMKHFAEDLDDVDSDNLWAYEGVVLPGGRIIVGRWWFASETVDFNVSCLEAFTMRLELTANSAITTDRLSFGPLNLTSSMKQATTMMILLVLRTSALKRALVRHVLYYLELWARASWSNIYHGVSAFEPRHWIYSHTRGAWDFYIRVAHFG